MATPDVPGANPKNNDVLAQGCWAEHEDGSLIYVHDVDKDTNRVIYEVFDMSKPEIVAYRDAMLIDGFKKTFSWNPADKKSIKWTWHDKSKFNWNRVIKAGLQDGPGYASAVALISAAAQTIKAHRRHTGQDIDLSDIPDDLANVDFGTTRPLTDKEKSKLMNVISKSKTAKAMFDGLQKAISKLKAS